ncbi:MAG: hypothetical protein KA327_03100 [Pseudarcicella sp.]|nr:hypothetical protein [Pseudarcicella sp.]
MARNIFDLVFILPPKRISIKETAVKLISLLEILRIEDNVFSKFKVSKLHFKSVEFNLEDNSFEKSVQKLSDTILRFELPDIKHYEKEENPTIDFSRDHGFFISFEFQMENKKHFNLFCNLASSQKNSLAIENFPFEKSDYNFDWYFNIFRKINQYLNPKYSGVNIILPQYMEMYLPLKIVYPLGWVTYFSNESNIKMPFDGGFEVIQEEKGQYIIATREDFTASKESFFAMKEHLIEGMKLLKERCPEYKETETLTQLILRSI